METKPGQYYERDDMGRWRPAAPGDAPDSVLCRRLADFPGGKLPSRGSLGRCVRCRSEIVYNAAGPHQDVQKVCMQCEGVEPLPFPN